MSRIRSRDTGPELRLRRALWAGGLRYRLHATTPVGRPDLVFPGPRVAVFVDGCFWHGCPEHYVRPRSRTDFWTGKLRANIDRDRRQTLELENQGWRVVRLWEHTVYEALPDAVEVVRLAVQQRSSPPVPPPTCWRVVLVEALDKTGDQERRHLEDLRDPEIRRFIDQPRHTRKWKRPAV